LLCAAALGHDNQPLQTLIWFLAGGALVLVLLTIGLAVSALLHRNDMSPGEDFMMALGGGIAATALAAVAQLPLPLAFTVVSPFLMVLLLAASAAILWMRRAWLLKLAADSQVRLMAAGVGVLFAMGLTVAALPWDKAGVGSGGTVASFHVPDMPGDTLLQYRTAQILQNRMPIETTPFYVNYWYISDRTPLVGLVTTFVTSSAGIALPTASLDTFNAAFQVIDPYGYWLYREISMLTNAMVVASAALLAWELLGVRAAKLGVVFILLSPFVFIGILFHWPKLLAGFFVAGFYFWSHVRRRPVWAGTFAAGAVLSHPVGALFLPGMFIYLLVARHWRQLLISGSVAALVVSPWFFWTSLFYHHASRMLTYPIGYALADPTNPGPEIRADLQAFIHRPLSSILGDRWVTIRDTFTTWPYLIQVIAARHLKELAVPLYEILRTTFPGMFGAGLAVFGYLSWKRIVTQPFWAATLGASTICLVLFWGIAPRAMTEEGFQPGVGLWICIAAALLAGLPAWVIRAAVAINVVEWLVFVYLMVDHTPSLGAWRVTWALLVALSLLLVVAIGAIGWRLAGQPSEGDNYTPTTGRRGLAHAAVE
jgi:hypothetical protein